MGLPSKSVPWSPNEERGLLTVLPSTCSAALPSSPTWTLLFGFLLHHLFIYLYIK